MLSVAHVIRHPVVYGAGFGESCRTNGRPSTLITCNGEFPARSPALQKGCVPFPKPTSFRSRNLHRSSAAARQSAPEDYPWDRSTAHVFRLPDHSVWGPAWSEGAPRVLGDLSTAPVAALHDRSDRRSL